MHLPRGSHDSAAARANIAAAVALRRLCRGGPSVWGTTSCDAKTVGLFTVEQDILNVVFKNPAYQHIRGGGVAPAVSKEGISVSIRNADEFEGIGKNTIVSCRLIGRGSGTFHISCEMNEVTAYDFDMNSAFRILMEDYAVDKISESISQQEEEDILESDRVLDESYVREVISYL